MNNWGKIMREDERRQYANRPDCRLAGGTGGAARVRGGGVVHTPKLKRMDPVREALRLKHQAVRTETCYCDWIRRKIRFHPMKARAALLPATGKVELFRSDLAAAGRVAASTQRKEGRQRDEKAAGLSVVCVIPCTLLARLGQVYAVRVCDREPQRRDERGENSEAEGTRAAHRAVPRIGPTSRGLSPRPSQCKHSESPILSQILLVRRVWFFSALFASRRLNWPSELGCGSAAPGLCGLIAVPLWFQLCRAGSIRGFSGCGA